ncbi:helicase-related protein [Nocardia carnea]|uniref:helicase-related protein n=1 Tax=Nocardia carnea TaxID=37328 RepID=UPI002458461C|nr:helicase-related protein [Nocardia carnea]
MTTKHEAHYSLREAIAERLREDLLGPAGGTHERLTDDQPITAYPTGVLFPRQELIEVREDSSPADGDDTPLEGVRGADDAEDVGVSLAGRRRPSSMGLTFAADPAIARALTVQVAAARYVPQDENGNPVAAERAQARSTEEQREQWQRVPLLIPSTEVDLTQPGTPRHDLGHGLELRAFVRRPDENGQVTVTLSLVNTLRVGKYDLQDAFCFYQLSLVVTGPPGTTPIVERRTNDGAVDSELELSRLLYRYAPIFATGHGCSAEWTWSPAPPGAPASDEIARVSEVRTTFVPAAEVLLTDSNPDISDDALAMGDLGAEPLPQVVAALTKLLDGYEEWIRCRTEEAEALADTEYSEAARTQLDHCAEALRRMRSGLSRLEDQRDPRVFQAFQLANLAMMQQRAQAQWARNGQKGRPVHDGRWRPFQIAFFLLCLDGIVEREHPDREFADLLWFPTGGGKTEAYLGLVAFTTFLRRLRDPEYGGGVTVLMRYTLRLLTLQQFERAATLICAMEILRRNDPGNLGAEEISIGMWVGASATPNRLDNAKKSIDRQREGQTVQKENPVQLQVCPWCGSGLDAGDYTVDEAATRLDIRCLNPQCEFWDGTGLPVHVVDETVYEARPTLVIATVDKFASIAWRHQTAALFNRDRHGDRTPPPELVIQDELHLISGRLGTLTGLYEAAIDMAADHPKVIASTATIRRAGDQGRQLFNRETRQFPPAGLDARDSWFAVETPRAAKATRLYVGLLTPSTSQATLLIRAYASLLHAAQAIDANDEVRDAYWTLVGYFNSLRLLAAAELQVHSDVDERLNFLSKREDVKPREVREQSELTSRATATEVPERLKLLERQYPNACDVMLATNMISVGVDVDRLGLMAVMGQPQTTAEYIQSTSRVGRKHPGLVVTLLNSSRSRDRSHYENFQGFHSALYREVESSSVTPFSTRSRDRGLHAVLIALARLLIPAARPNDAASQIEMFRDELGEITEKLLERVHDIDPEEVDHTRTALAAIIRWWSETAEEKPELVYDAGRSRKDALLGIFGEAEELERLDTLWSLRDVDAESALFLRK